MIALGASVGGGAALALAARKPPGLKAAVNLAGAMRITNEQGNSDPRRRHRGALASFGKQTKTPTLWIYSENDSNFGPDAARKAHAAYVAQGGVPTKIVPSLHPADGHNVFELPAGRQHWLAALDPFLRTHKLPTWSAQQMKTVMQRFNIGADQRPVAGRIFHALHPEGPDTSPERRASSPRPPPGTRAGAEERPGGMREGGEDAVTRHHAEFQRGRPVRPLRRPTDTVAPLTPIAAPVEASQPLDLHLRLLGQKRETALGELPHEGVAATLRKALQAREQILGIDIALLQPTPEHQIHVIERDLARLAADAKPGKHPFGIIVGNDQLVVELALGDALPQIAGTKAGDGARAADFRRTVYVIVGGGRTPTNRPTTSSQKPCRLTCSETTPQPEISSDMDHPVRPAAAAAQCRKSGPTASRPDSGGRRNRRPAAQTEPRRPVPVSLNPVEVVSPVA